MDIQQGCEHLEIGRRAAHRLYIHSPLLWIELVCLECTLLTEKLRLVNELVATIVARTGIALRILVLHNRAQSIQDTLRCKVFRSDEVDATALPVRLARDDTGNLRVRVDKVCVQVLRLHRNRPPAQEWCARTNPLCSNTCNASHGVCNKKAGSIPESVSRSG